MVRTERRSLNNGEEAREVGSEREGEKEALQRKPELWASVCILVPSPFSSDSKQSPLCAATSELEVDAFHRQAAIHSSGSSQPIGNQRGRATVQRATKNVSAIDLFPG